MLLGDGGGAANDNDIEGQRWPRMKAEQRYDA